MDTTIVYEPDRDRHGSQDRSSSEFSEIPVDMSPMPRSPTSSSSAYEKPYFNETANTIHLDMDPSLYLDHQTDAITAKSLYELHQMQMTNGNNNNTEKTLQIAAILGGIDRILSHYLNESMCKDNSFTLSEHQRLSIHDYLTTSTNYTSPNHNDTVTHVDKQTFANCEDCDLSVKLRYEFDENNNYLKTYFPQKVTNSISQWIHTSVTGLGCALIAFIGTIIMMVCGEESLIYMMYSMVSHCVYLIPYFMLHISCADRNAVKLTLNTFEFWLKIGYQYYYATLWTIYAVNRYKHGHNNTLYLVQNLIGNVAMFPLTIAWAALFDAMRLNKSYKVAVSAVCCCFWTWHSFYWTFLVPAANDVVINVPFANREVSITSLMADSLRIVAIFFAKQTILSLYRNGQCVLIKVSPFIDWKNSGLRIVSSISEMDKTNRTVVGKDIAVDKDVRSV